MLERLSRLFHPKLSVYDLIRYGRDYYELRDYGRSWICFTKALAMLTDNADLYSRRGKMNYDLKQYRSALSDFEHALALDSQYSDACSNQGRAYFEIKDFKKLVDDEYNDTCRIVSMQD